MSRADKKVESEIITDTYLFDDVRMAVYFGSEKLFLKFVSMRAALLERMIVQTFHRDNYFIKKEIAGHTIVLNATAWVFLEALENMLEDYGWIAQLTLSEGYLNNPTTLKNLGTNVRRIDRIDDAKAVDPTKRNRITLEPREHAEISKGQFHWTVKSWEVFFSDAPIKLGGAGEVQHSNITEDKIRIFTNGITHAVENDILYQRFAIMEEKITAATKAGKELIDSYLSMFDEGVAKMIVKKNQITRISGNSLVELRSLMRVFSLIKKEDENLGKLMEDGNIAKFISYIVKSEEIMLEMKEREEEMNTRYDKIKVQVLHLSKQLEKYDLLIKERNIDLGSIKEDEELLRAADIDMKKISTDLSGTRDPIVTDEIFIEGTKVTVPMSPIAKLRSKIHDIFYPKKLKEEKKDESE